ncbi:MAG: hypothetical protein AB7S38_27525 [Vulcanimicrobiota bacterium]
MKVSSFTRVVGAGLGGATLAGANVALGGVNPWLGAAGSVGTGIGLAAWTQAGEAALPAMAVGGIQAACGAYGGPQMALPLAAAGGAVGAYLSLRDEFKSSPPGPVAEAAFKLASHGLLGAGLAAGTGAMAVNYGFPGLVSGGLTTFLSTAAVAEAPELATVGTVLSAGLGGCAMASPGLLIPIAAVGAGLGIVGTFQDENYAKNLDGRQAQAGAALVGASTMAAFFGGSAALGAGHQVPGAIVSALSGAAGLAAFTKAGEAIIPGALITGALAACGAYGGPGLAASLTLGSGLVGLAAGLEGESGRARSGPTENLIRRTLVGGLVTAGVLGGTAALTHAYGWPGFFSAAILSGVSGLLLGGVPEVGGASLVGAAVGGGLSAWLGPQATLPLVAAGAVLGAAGGFHDNYGAVREARRQHQEAVEEMRDLATASEPTTRLEEDEEAITIGGFSIGKGR